MTPTTSELNDDELYQGYLTKVYKPFQKMPMYLPIEQQMYRNAGVCITYGELLYPSVKVIIQHLSQEADDVFLDLGSGLGKCALQVFMQTDLSHVIGIEASRYLHDFALNAVHQVKTDFPFFWEENRRLTLVGENFLDANWLDPTIVYCCSTCFTQELLITIGNKINQQKQVKQVFSFRPLASLNMPLKKIFRIECSWDSALCFFYDRRK
jgi:hypothetical protein